MCEWIKTGLPKNLKNKQWRIFGLKKNFRTPNKSVDVENYRTLIKLSRL